MHHPPAEPPAVRRLIASPLQVLASFDVVLVTEYLDDPGQAALLAPLGVGRFPSPAPRRNACRGADPELRAQLDGAVDAPSLAWLRELNAADLELFDYACRLVRHRVRAASERLHDAGGGVDDDGGGCVCSTPQGVGGWQDLTKGPMLCRFNAANNGCMLKKQMRTRAAEEAKRKKSGARPSRLPSR